MRAGDLRHAITIEAATATQNSFGEPVQSWEPFAQAWASREELSGRESFVADQKKHDVLTRFVTRFLPGITPQMRLRSGEDLYEIVSATDEEGRRRTLIILATGRT